jgi:hypothetical protein
LAEIFKFKLPKQRSWTSLEARYFCRLRREGKFGLLVPFDPNGPRRKVPRVHLTPKTLEEVRAMMVECSVAASRGEAAPDIMDRLERLSRKASKRTATRRAKRRETVGK